jgi:hypothetical protein
LFASFAVARAETLILDLPQPPPARDLSFDLRSEEGLAGLASAVETLIQFSEAQECELKEQRERMLAGTPLTAMPLSQLHVYFHDPDDTINRRERRGLKEIQRLARAALGTHDVHQREPLVNLIREVAAAIDNNHRSPVPARLDFVEFPIKLFRHIRNPLGHGHTIATNLTSGSRSETDSSELDPRPASFWQQRTSIGVQDLYAGFGRVELPRYDERTWDYDEPKTGYGGNPGFKVVSGDQKLKVKFGEITSEPFTARIFHALGYHVDSTDYADHLKIRYSRRLFREFHLRKEIKTRFTVFGALPAYTMKLQRRFDPFACIAWAEMKDGTRVSGLELKARLFRKPKLKHPEDHPDNFRPEVESQIDFLVTVAANIQSEEEKTASIGPWDFGQLGHEHLRELRGVGLLAAWLGWFDSRFENTRLKIVDVDGRKELRHYLSDVGGGLGRGSGLFSPRGELPNEFGWTFTRAVKSANGAPAFRVVDFKPIDDTPAFSEMTVADARWMARLIAQLTEEQIVQALVAAGFDYAQVKLYAEKLISRRDRMVRDLGLAGEIAPLRPNGANRTLSYDPALDEPVRIRTTDGREIITKRGSSVVEMGRLVTKAGLATAGPIVSRARAGSGGD